ncbi:hypothetical protein [Acinetobacter sp.]|uniref:hypothetical protein n=1 Tax=Acinetobacter sp. TaxID=472 RepID=UPI003D09061A
MKAQMSIPTINATFEYLRGTGSFDNTEHQFIGVATVGKYTGARIYADTYDRLFIKLGNVPVYIEPTINIFKKVD